MSDIIVSSSVAVALLPVILLTLISLIAFLFRQVSRSNESLARISGELEDIHRHVERLEQSEDRRKR